MITGLCDLVKTVLDLTDDSNDVPNYQIISPIILLLSVLRECVCACLCVCVHMCVFVYVSVHTCACVCAYICVLVCACIHVCACACACLSVCTCKCEYIISNQNFVNKISASKIISD